MNWSSEALNTVIASTHSTASTAMMSTSARGLGRPACFNLKKAGDKRIVRNTDNKNGTTSEAETFKPAKMMTRQATVINGRSMAPQAIARHIDQLGVQSRHLMDCFRPAEMTR
jgi:hypothetical protein